MISTFDVGEPTQLDGGWIRTVRWETENASRAVLSVGDERYDVDPDAGSKAISLKESSQTATLTAYGANSEEVVRSITIEREPLPDPEGESPPTPDGTPTITSFSVGDQVDFPFGTIYRLIYNSDSGTRYTLSWEGEEVELSPDERHVDVFTWRPLSAVLTAYNANGATKCSLDINPNAPEAKEEQKKHPLGVPLFDDIDMISYLANVVDFSQCETRAANSIIDGYLHRMFARVTKQGFDVLRNAVCARRGFIFKRQDLQDVFKNRPWYDGDTTDGTVLNNRLTPLEKRNIQWLRNRQDATQ